jgi:hypothetical protein
MSIMGLLSSGSQQFRISCVERLNVIDPSEDRILELCSQFVAAEDLAELQRLYGELQRALTEHINRLRIRMADDPKFGTSE